MCAKGRSVEEVTENNKSREYAKVESIGFEAKTTKVQVPFLWLGPVISLLQASILLSINGNNICFDIVRIIKVEYIFIKIIYVKQNIVYNLMSVHAGCSMLEWIIRHSKVNVMWGLKN